MAARPSPPGVAQESIGVMRAAVRDRLLRASPNVRTTAVEALAGSDLRLLFSIYDDLFFSDQLQALLETSSSQIAFVVSMRMTSAGANISHRHTRTAKTHQFYRVAVSAPVLFASFRGAKPVFLVNGIACSDRLQALLILMEHELVHLYEMLTTSVSSHGSGFRRIAGDLFGHTDYRHALMTPAHQASASLRFHLGDAVSFSFEGRLVGRLNRITKRATVLVPDELGSEYQDGQNYRKFYVPVSALAHSRDGAS